MTKTKKHTALFQTYNWEKSSFFNALVHVFAQIYANTFNFTGIITYFKNTYYLYYPFDRGRAGGWGGRGQKLFGQCPYERTSFRKWASLIERVEDDET